ncbi:glucan synthase-like 7, callose synthase 7, Arabidopsis thaliana glucan synthase-like 7 [Hibiscus trionum]|uniref:1,3-beta-glucan synthase n=1 Tax=Hibiscus trionum TaxID=183268 RepID=A0A9W7IQA6_HIBTR|nr:glucan synthase-like 7, callose synthase 7, Arabidopsis thaliana glucan synthase-like 7 [Hibiscus trionum]GMJ00725.1 glucan synthase-like 7, callose synthase 7, Arabidopsis thaliana glucan synthase-like 7 [Hibiscus trionum]
MASSSGTKRPPPPPPPPPFARLMMSRDPKNEDYNILPFDDSPIMKLTEIKTAVEAVSKMENLPRIDGVVEKDIFYWLSSVLGFQKGNTANQREHLILLLANIHTRRKDLGRYDEVEATIRTIRQLKNEFFSNYELWCKYMHIPSCTRNNEKYPEAEKQRRHLIYIALYLLIWGEASNIRFMPECICYIFHKMANDVHQILSTTNTTQIPAESFLSTVIKPIYLILSKEAGKNKEGKASHSQWSNYDDLNECFWSKMCSSELHNQKEGMPLPPADKILNQFFVGNQFNIGRWKPKSNFVEVRTFWQLYRSFDRMWLFFIMALQAMIIVAWTHSGSTFEDVLRRVLSIFITYAVLSFLRAILDTILSIHAWRCSELDQLLRHLLKLVVASIWLVVLPVAYSTSVKDPTGLLKFLNQWTGDSHDQSLYNYLVVLYMIPDVLGIILFLLQPLREKMELSDWPVINIVMWWAQPKLYVGRGMHVGTFSLLKYTIFWILVLSVKLAFSYFVEILPLVRPTKVIMKIDINDYQLYNFVPNVKHHMGVIIAIWAPIVLIYFMDVQIWYAIFSTLIGGALGAFRHLGEIRTIGMLQSRFESMPLAFDRCFVPPSGPEAKAKNWRTSKEPKNMAKFSQMWNEFIRSMRMEDLISNKDRNLLLLPSFPIDESKVQWPLFLLASKIPAALNMAKEFKGKDDAELRKNIGRDKYTCAAIQDFYYTLKHIVCFLLEDEDDRKIVEDVYGAITESLDKKVFLKNFNVSGMPFLAVKLEKLLEILMAEQWDDKALKNQITLALQDIMEIVILDVMVEDKSTLEGDLKRNQISHKYYKKQRFRKINTNDVKSEFWSEKVNRLHLLLTVKESATDVPLNSEARRRITFFANSLFMNMRSAPKVSNMRSFSVLTPHYKEEVLYSIKELEKDNEDGVSILFYLKTIYPDEWTNFMERMNNKPQDGLREWVSYRGQTLSRSVRGMMYYKKALELQCSMEFANSISNEDHIREKVLPDLKFTYVVSCQIYGILKRLKDPRQQDILNLLLMYPSLRVAYIDEVEEPVTEKTEGKTKKVYYSVLLKGDTNTCQEREIYRIKLPGLPTKIGEGKPENQNHAIIFTRGEALQTIDMNQDNYFEEAFKMRNVLEEFPHSHGSQKPTILGLREHVFTGSVSSLAWFMSNQETSFVTIGQRFLASPLRVRFHYGHPDIFDRIFHITRGGISKASKTINLSEDIFAGFNSTLRLGSVTHHDYMQVGKGRDVGMNQISLFEAKVANGNGEQTLSRDVHRLGCQFDFFRMLSFYCTTVGFYFNSMVVVLVVYVFLYGRLYMVMTGLERDILEDPQIKHNNALEAALLTQSFIQMGMLLVLPMLMEIGLEKGFRAALGDFIIMQLQLASMFFTFQLGTKAHYFGRTILHGGSKYRATGRGFVVQHAKFSDNYRLYSRSHFVKALELGLLLVIYEVYGESYRNSSLYLFITFSMWFLVGSWLFAPFIFNPSGFEWQKTVNDWTDWRRWMGIRGGIGIQPENSWESWWDEEQEHLRYTSIRGRVLEILLALRFFVYQFGIVYHLDIAHHRRSLLVYGLSWCAVLVLLIVPKMVSVRRLQMFHMDLQLPLRMLKGLLFLIFLAIMIILFKLCGLTLSDLFASILAFMPTGWGFILVGQACRHCLHKLLWEPMKELARAYDFMMGLVLFTPIAFLSWLPAISEFQTRILFNQAFSRGLHISMILAGKRDGGASSM